MLSFSLILLSVAMIVNFPFPHKDPYGESVLAIFNIPIKFANGFHTVGITTLLLLVVGIYFLVKSLKKYAGRIALIVIVIVIFAPTFLVNSFQKNFATGIYAVSYTSEESKCRFEMADQETLYGECDLSFKNHSNKDVQFTVEFYEEHLFKDELPMVSLMNNGAPFEVMLRGKENKRAKVTADIDVSAMEKHIEGGEAMGVNITITSKGKSRNL